MTDPDNGAGWPDDDAGWPPDESADPLLVARPYMRANWPEHVTNHLLLAIIERLDQILADD